MLIPVEPPPLRRAHAAQLHMLPGAHLLDQYLVCRRAQIMVLSRVPQAVQGHVSRVPRAAPLQGRTGPRLRIDRRRQPGVIRQLQPRELISSKRRSPPDDAVGSGSGVRCWAGVPNRPQRRWQQRWRQRMPGASTFSLMRWSEPWAGPGICPQASGRRYFVNSSAGSIQTRMLSVPRSRN